ncbi:hypothetical protein FBZ93_102167 [Bradyrhizobium macuxiense]|uniref:Uncharacterized protein n=1 Tax=Bradyrhizobium macuxiense TaxID=1755647 RepID=A0A560ME06_9BRAD|nr:hypothetical protein [Bradyrhizobium macuxiense]TWC05854.1 hypothetical protein FBZ93_102167 [Bradyrhizobium macuxiense]
MSDLRGQSPRRYVVDVSGRRVLVGLTLEETSEFEGLDTSLPVLDGEGQDRDALGREALDREALGAEPVPSAVEGRWLELYHKHDKAWIKWKADLRAGQERDSPFFN